MQGQLYFIVKSTPFMGCGVQHIGYKPEVINCVCVCVCVCVYIYIYIYIYMNQASIAQRDCCVHCEFSIVRNCVAKICVHLGYDAISVGIRFQQSRYSVVISCSVALEKLRKAILSFIMSVRPSA
jgi:hypothetical protein